MTRRTAKALSVAALGVGSLFLGACGGDSGADLGPSDFVMKQVPRCDKTTVVDSELVNTQIALTRLHELIELASISPDGQAAAETSPQGFDVAGPCGGWVYFTPVEGEDDLVTDYELDLQGYCVASPEGDVHFTGQVQSQELARALDGGAVVSELRTNFDDLLGMQGNEVFKVSMSDGRTLYGRPGDERPLPPTESEPDEISIASVVVNHESAGVTDRVTGFEARRWQVPAGEALVVEAGKYLHGKSGDRFELGSRGAPLIADPETGEWLDGVLTLASKVHPGVEISPSDTPGEYRMVVPGNRVGELGNCEVIEKLSAER